MTALIALSLIFLFSDVIYRAKLEETFTRVSERHGRNDFYEHKMMMMMTGNWDNKRLSPPSTSPGKKTYSALDTSNARVVTETKETVEGQKSTLDYYTMETGISLRRVGHFLAFGTF